MKKIILMSSLLLLLGACSSKEETIKEEKTKQVNVEIQKTNDNKSQEELNEQLKKEAKKADIVELNVDNPPIGKKVFVDGEVSSLSKNDSINEFVLRSKENDGNGMYKIKLINTIETDFNEGDQVRIYGAVTGKDETGTLEILASILENK